VGSDLSEACEFVYMRLAKYMNMHGEGYHFVVVIDQTNVQTETVTSAKRGLRKCVFDSSIETNNRASFSCLFAISTRFVTTSFGRQLGFNSVNKQN
jgi:hypothetical protein